MISTVYLMKLVLGEKAQPCSCNWCTALRRTFDEGFLVHLTV